MMNQVLALVLNGNFIDLRSLTLALHKAVQFHRLSAALHKLKRPRPVPKTSCDQSQSQGEDEHHADPSAADNALEKELLQRLGSEYLRLLKTTNSPLEVMDPLQCVRLLFAFTEVDFNPGGGAKGLMVSVCGVYVGRGAGGGERKRDGYKTVDYIILALAKAPSHAMGCRIFAATCECMSFPL